MRHPDTYADEELDEWIRHLVDNEVEEGPRLDYKAQLNLSTPKDRREAAKDVTSFANEVGGVLLYGMPEKRTNDKTAVPCRPYGIDPAAGVESQLENVYIDGIRPSLGEWRIRPIPLSEYPGKVAYLVWTPESWLGPHMVEAFGDRRYYRRGQLRAVEMAEHEVRERYQRTQRAQDRLERFLASHELNFSEIYFWRAPTGGSHYVIAPHTLYDRIDFTAANMRSWLDTNPYPGPTSQWIPSAVGVRTSLQEKRTALGIVRDDFLQVFRNGAISHWRETEGKLTGDDGFLIASVAELRKVQTLLTYARRLFAQIGYWGPLRVEATIRAQRPRIVLAVGQWSSEFPTLLSPDGAVHISFEHASSDLLADPKSTLRRMADELFRAFGLWDAASLFDEHGNFRR